MSRRHDLARDWANHPKLSGEQIDELLAHSPAEQPPTGEWKRLSKPGIEGRERWAWQTGQNGETLFVKRYLSGGLRTQLDRILRQAATHSRAYWEYAQSERLAEAGVPAVRAVGFAEEMSGPFERRSVVLFERVPGDAFDRVWMRLVASDSPLTRGLARHDFAKRIGRFAAAFHGTGLCHRDLYLCHIFIDLDESMQRAPRLTMIDLARLHRPRWRRMRWVLKDLSQLDASAREIGASRSDRLRALYSYLALNRRSPRVRWYVRAVVRRSDRILQRIARKRHSST